MLIAGFMNIKDLVIETIGPDFEVDCFLDYFRDAHILRVSTLGPNEVKYISFSIDSKTLKECNINDLNDKIITNCKELIEYNNEYKKLQLVKKLVND